MSGKSECSAKLHYYGNGGRSDRGTYWWGCLLSVCTIKLFPSDRAFWRKLRIRTSVRGGGDLSPDYVPPAYPAPFIHNAIPQEPLRSNVTIEEQCYHCSHCKKHCQYDNLCPWIKRSNIKPLRKKHARYGKKVAFLKLMQTRARSLLQYYFPLQTQAEKCIQETF